MLKLLKFTSHGIRDLDIMRGVRVRCAELPNSRCAELPKSRCAVWLHCAAVRTTSIENVCVWLILWIQCLGREQPAM